MPLMKANPAPAVSTFYATLPSGLRNALTATKNRPAHFALYTATKSSSGSRSGKSCVLPDHEWPCVIPGVPSGIGLTASAEWSTRWKCGGRKRRLQAKKLTRNAVARGSTTAGMQEVEQRREQLPREARLLSSGQPAQGKIGRPARTVKAKCRFVILIQQVIGSEFQPPC